MNESYVGDDDLDYDLMTVVPLMMNTYLKKIQTSRVLTLVLNLIDFLS